MTRCGISLLRHHFAQEGEMPLFCPKFYDTMHIAKLQTEISPLYRERRLFP